MQPKKVKTLDQFRPNVLPRLSSTSPEKSSFVQRTSGDVSESLKREKLLEILSQTDKGSVIVRPDVLKLMEKKRLEEKLIRMEKKWEKIDKGKVSKEALKNYEEVMRKLKDGIEGIGIKP